MHPDLLSCARAGMHDAGMGLNQASCMARYVPYVTEPKYDSVIIPTNNYSLAYARTFTEVLAIAYGGNPAVPGVFFPDGEPPSWSLRHAILERSMPLVPSTSC